MSNLNRLGFFIVLLACMLPSSASIHLPPSIALGVVASSCTPPIGLLVSEIQDAVDSTNCSLATDCTAEQLLAVTASSGYLGVLYTDFDANLLRADYLSSAGLGVSLGTTSVTLQNFSSSVQSSLLIQGGNATCLPDQRIPRAALSCLPNADFVRYDAIPGYGLYSRFQGVYGGYPYGLWCKGLEKTNDTCDVLLFWIVGVVIRRYISDHLLSSFDLSAVFNIPCH